MVAMCMRSSHGNQRGNAALIVLVLVVLALAIGPLALHFTQKRHNVLPLDVAAAYPPDQPIVPGEVYAATVRAIILHELKGGTGWRPNDFFLWGPSVLADNNANRQLGIIQALRESVRVFKDHLTKVSSDQFDPNLVIADTAFRNDAAKFWLPSAEGKFEEGAKALQRYIDGLKPTPPTSKTLNRRNVELIRLFQVWMDLLGDAHANLYKDREQDGSRVRPWRNDDYYYHAQGFAHVMYHLSLAVRREYQDEFRSRPMLMTMLDEVATALGRATLQKPLIVFDGSPSGIFANHRRNLDVYIIEARQKMYSMREELEK